MKTIRMLAAAAAFLLAAGTAPAQPGPGPGAGPGASAPGAGRMGGAMGGAMGGPMGGPMGGRMGGGPMGGRWGSDFTPGWAMMTPQEREQHQSRMREMKTYDECHAYVEQHHQQMAERAKEKGGSVPAMPRRDACAGLKK